MGAAPASPVPVGYMQQPMQPMVTGQGIPMQNVQTPNPVYAPPIANTGVMTAVPGAILAEATTTQTVQSVVQSQPVQGPEVVTQVVNDGPPPQYPGKA